MSLVKAKAGRRKGSRSAGEREEEKKMQQGGVSNPHITLTTAGKETHNTDKDRRKA